MASYKKLFELVQQHLDPDEPILASVVGAYETQILGSNTVRNGMFAATDRRVIFYAKKMVGYDFESFPYDNISSFEQSKGLMGHKVKFFASGNEAAVKWINQGELDDLVREVRSRMRGGTSAAVPAAPPMPDPAADPVPTTAPSRSVPPNPVADPVEEIRRYAALRDDGIITEEEFQEKKRQLLF
jgi:hypothetical protein